MNRIMPGYWPYIAYTNLQTKKQEPRFGMSSLALKSFEPDQYIAGTSHPKRKEEERLQNFLQTEDVRFSIREDLLKEPLEQMLLTPQQVRPVFSKKSNGHFVLSHQDPGYQQDSQPSETESNQLPDTHPAVMTLKSIFRDHVPIPFVLTNGQLVFNEAFRKNIPWLFNRLIMREDKKALNLKDQFGMTAVHTAILTRRLPEAKALLKKGANPFKTDNQGHTALEQLANLGQTETLNQLLKYTDPSFKRAEVNTIKALQETSSKAAKEIDNYKNLYRALSAEEQKTMLSNLVPPPATLTDDSTQALKIAALAELGVVIQPGNMPLLLVVAAQNGHTAIVQTLLAHGANVNQAEEQRGAPPLLQAAFKGHMTIVETLLAHGAEVNQADKVGDTPLLLAAQDGHTDIVQALLAHGAEVNKADKVGDTPLLLAAENGHTTIVQALLAHDANVNHANQDGDTPLKQAAQNGHTDIVQALLTYGANVNQANQKGITPLLLAAQDGHTDIVQALLTYGANVNQANQEDITPLRQAAQNGHTAIVQALLDHGANVNHANQDGLTPLRQAAQDGHMDIVQALLAHGAKVNHVDRYGLTPLWLAEKKGHMDIAQVLKEKL